MKTTQINIPIHGNTLLGNLNIPNDAESLVIFSHGSGSSRFSKRNIHVANLLNQSKIATLLTDLLTTEEDEIYEYRFDIDLLTQRLIEVTNFVAQLPDLKNLPIGYFGASTGAASAIKAAAHLNDSIYAVVSRGGRADLADTDLKFVKAPTMLIVGSLDGIVVELNKQAYKFLQCDKNLKILDGATHLFEEPGMLDQVVDLATEWFKQHNIKSKTQSYALHK
jgi:putative phosphoribosyl transferase